MLGLVWVLLIDCGCWLVVIRSLVVLVLGLVGGFVRGWMCLRNSCSYLGCLWPYQ